jgi:hypothetical protein
MRFCRNAKMAEKDTGYSAFRLPEGAYLKKKVYTLLFYRFDVKLIENFKL